MQAWVKNAPLWISLKIIIELSFFRRFKLIELTLANLSISACKFVDWTEHFMEEAVNTFKFGHTVNQIQPNCCLVEYTAVPKSSWHWACPAISQTKSYFYMSFCRLWRYTSKKSAVEIAPRMCKMCCIYCFALTSDKTPEFSRWGNEGTCLDPKVGSKPDLSDSKVHAHSMHHHIL